MAKRPNLGVVNLKDTGARRPAEDEPARTNKAQTLRLPPDYWYRLKVAAALKQTHQHVIVQKALDEWFERNPLPPGV